MNIEENLKKIAKNIDLDEVALVSWDLVKLVGVDSCFLLSRLALEIFLKGEEKDGKLWVRRPLEEWQEIYTYLSVSTIRRCLDKLEKDGYITVAYFNESPFDRTKWYTVDLDKEWVKTLAEQSNELTSDC